MCDRQDGRRANELRAISIENGHLHKFDGSCQFCIGDTCVEVSVVGPVVSRKHRNSKKIECAHLDVTVQSAQGTISSHELYLKQQVAQVCGRSVMLGKYPLTTIYLQVQVLCDAGSLLMAMLNAVSIALLDSGIDCRSFPVSVALGVSDRRLLFDPTQKEMESSLDASATLSFATSLRKVTASTADSSGNVLVGDYKKRKRKSRVKQRQPQPQPQEEEEAAAEAEAEDYSDMDLLYCDLKGRVQMDTLKRVLRECKVACYTIQFFIKRHFVQSFKALPTIYVDPNVEI